MDQREADAAEAGIPRLHRRQGQSGRYRRIDRVAAGVEHGDPGLGRRACLRDHHAAFAFADGLVSNQFCVTCGERV